MIKILKNDRRQGITGWFRGRSVWFGPKAGIGFDDEDEEQTALYYYWKETFGMRDITKKEEK